MGKLIVTVRVDGQDGVVKQVLQLNSLKGS